MTFVYLDMRSRGPGNSEVTVETGVIIGAQPAVLLANLVSGGGDTPPPPRAMAALQGTQGQQCPFMLDWASVVGYEMAETCLPFTKETL